MQTLNAPSKIYYAKKSTPCWPVDASVVVDATCWDVTCSFVVLDVTVVCVGGSNEECRWRAEIYKNRGNKTFDVLFSQFLALNERNNQDDLYETEKKLLKFWVRLKIYETEKRLKCPWVRRNKWLMRLIRNRKKNVWSALLVNFLRLTKDKIETLGLEF